MLQDIHNLSERQYKATIGIGKKDFQRLTAEFSECEQALKNRHYEEFQAFYGRKPSAGGKPA